MYTCAHTHTHTHTERACTTCSEIGSYFSHKVYMCIHVHTHMHVHTHTQTGLVPLAVTLGSYFPHCHYKACMCMNVHTCAHTHAHTHTQTGLVPLLSFYKAYMCMNEHTYTHSTTFSDFGFLFLTLSLFSQSMYMCMNVHT